MTHGHWARKASNSFTSRDSRILEFIQPIAYGVSLNSLGSPVLLIKTVITNLSLKNIEGMATVNLGKV